MNTGIDTMAPTQRLQHTWPACRQCGEPMTMILTVPRYGRNPALEGWRCALQ
jgi:hypothetical protein